MSHLRDLQRLRNTKYNFQIKKSSNAQPAELKLNDIRKPRPSIYNNEPLIMPEIIIPKVLEIEAEHETDPYSKYLQSK